MHAFKSIDFYNSMFVGRILELTKNAWINNKVNMQKNSKLLADLSVPVLSEKLYWERTWLYTNSCTVAGIVWH